MLIGVTIKKKIIPITIGATKLPSKIPNLYQYLFKGDNNLEFINPKSRKIKDATKDHCLTSFPFIIGQNAINKKMKKKTNPKLRFVGSLLFLSTNFNQLFFYLIQKQSLIHSILF